MRNMEGFDMLITVILLMIVALLIFCLIVLLKIRDVATTTASIASTNFNEAIQSVLNQQNQEVAKIYAEEQRLLNHIEVLLEDDELDLLELVDSTSRRAMALSIKRAEDSVVLAESDLEEIRLKISEVVQRATKNMKDGYKSFVREDKEALSSLKQQEKEAEERVKEAHERLAKLQTAIRSQTK